MKRTTGHLTTTFFSANALVLAALYLVFSIGVIKATHFCMGSEASVAFFTSEAKACACKASPLVIKDDCCHEQYELLKISDFQKKLSVLEVRFPAFTLLSIIYHHIADETASAAFYNALGQGMVTSSTPLFELFCSFIFYDETPAV